MTRKHDTLALAERLHAVAIHLLRRVRKVDDATGLTAPKLSALSVLVYGGAKTLGELARIEQVRPPTMTRIVQELQKAGLVARRVNRDDARVVHASATTKGIRLLHAGRTRRAQLIADWLSTANEREQRSVTQAVTTLEAVLRQTDGS